jgi:hypothetical protein
MYDYGLTDFRLSLPLTADVDSAFESLHSADVSCIHDVSFLSTASIFRAEVFRECDFSLRH